MWQLEWLRAIQRHAAGDHQIAQLWVLGSAATPEQLDAVADLDIGLVVTGPVHVADLVASCPDRPRLWAVDSQVDEQHATCRMAFAGGRRLDLMAAHYPIRFTESGGRLVERWPDVARVGSEMLLLPEAPTDPVANRVRFRLSLTAASLARGDRLIGTQLLLGVLQDCFEEAIRVLERDQGGPAARSGRQRDSLTADVLGPLRSGEIDAVTVEAVVRVFDRLHAELESDYRPDWSGLPARVAYDREAWR